MAAYQPSLRARGGGDALSAHARSRIEAFHRWYWVRMQMPHGRYPAAIAVGSSAKNTRRFA